MEKVYIASPLGFSESGTAFLESRIIPAVKSAGFIPVNPWDEAPEAMLLSAKTMPPGEDRHRAWRDICRVIGRTNEELISACGIMLAVLDGPDVDSGTASEIGYASAQGKPVIGYRSDFRQAGDNEGSTVNLQVEHFIYRNGGFLISCCDDIPEALSKIRLL